MTGYDHNVIRHPSGTAYVTTYKSKIIQMMDDIRLCKTDEEALNGWRLLCSTLLAWVGDIASSGTLSPNTSEDALDSLRKRWKNFRSAEKVHIEYGLSGNLPEYTLHWDGYVAEAHPRDVELISSILNKDKFAEINHRMATFVGDCLTVIMQSGQLTPKDQIEMPVRPSDEYTEEKMGDDMLRRRLPIRQKADAPR